MSKSVPQDKQATLQAVRMSFQKVKPQKKPRLILLDCNGPWPSLGNAHALELLRHDGSTTLNGDHCNSSGKAQNKSTATVLVIIQ